MEQDPSSFSPASYEVDCSPLLAEAAGGTFALDPFNVWHKNSLDLLDKIALHLSAASPELAKALAANRFDLKYLIREIVNSDAYQLSGTGASRAALPKWYERARVRPLTAEELVASMRAANGFEVNPKDPNPNWEYFLRAFGEPNNGLGEFQGSLSENLFLNNSEQVRQLFRRKKGNLADKVLTSTEPWEQRVELMYLSVLSRKPSPKELETFVSFIKREPKPDGAVEDVQARRRQREGTVLRVVVAVGVRHHGVEAVETAVEAHEHEHADVGDRGVERRALDEPVEDRGEDDAHEPHEREAAETAHFADLEQNGAGTASCIHSTVEPWI